MERENPMSSCENWSTSPPTEPGWYWSRIQGRSNTNEVEDVRYKYIEGYENKILCVWNSNEDWIPMEKYHTPNDKIKFLGKQPQMEWSVKPLIPPP